MNYHDTILSSKNLVKELKISKEDGKSSSSTKKLPITLFLIALIGAALSMWGASWDITSHLLRTPETFFTPSHALLYLGVGISLISAILNLALLLIKKQARNTPFVFGSKLIIIGAVLQIIAGPGDFYWHELFGIDGLLSPTHITLALGIMIVSLGAVIGFGRIHSHLTEKNNFLKLLLLTSFGIFWFSVMWFVFFFVLPISEGDTHNFNPDPYVAIVLSFVALPFAFSIVFWFISKTFNSFGVASISTLVFIGMNITSNIITSEKLLMYLPWFAAPLISAIVADYILNNKIKSKLAQKHSDKISGLVLGSMFFIFCFPMLAMTFLEPYLFNDVFSYDVLHTSSDTISQIWLMSIIPGAISGMFGMMFASRYLNKNLKINTSSEKSNV
jgi:hypothetical protein